MEDETKRPWGYYEILSDAPDHKVKRIYVKAAKRLSYQYHKRRNEHWFVVSGAGVATLDGEQIKLKAGDSINIPKHKPHRVKSAPEETFVFIEIQTGDYFGEDDIVRIEDDFDRV